MGVKDLDALRSLCAELSSDEPSPGGGTASAVAGAMAASLMSMVCAITAKSRKHEADRLELEDLRRSFAEKRDELVRLATMDAEAYDLVVKAAREKGLSRSRKTSNDYERALAHAAEVPMRTAQACYEVLSKGLRVEEIGKKSARSDVGVAVLLADAGLRGALMNVRINVAGLTDRPAADALGSSASALERRGNALVKDLLARL